MSNLNCTLSDTLTPTGGINCPQTPVGIQLGGESSYEAYSPVLVPLIALLHSGKRSL